MKRMPWYHWMMGLVVGSVLAIAPLFSQAPQEGDGPEKGIFDQAVLADAEPPPAQEGVEPLAKGVVHEGFATPTVFAAQSGNTVPKVPPQAIEEMPPEQKPDGDNVQWINGYFAYEEDKTDFIWISGIWRNIPPSMEWVPGAWNQVTDGWQYFSGFWKRASEGELQVVPMPPEPLQTADPPAPSADSTYIPGSWVYRETRYVWRPACWAAHRPGWVWVAARYQWTRCGYVFCEGYYDYVLQERGLLYCPVYINPTYYRRANWVYRPQYVVHDQALLSCLFVQRRTGCYYFGNYYDNAYRNSGYVAWSSYRVNRYPEPLFAHYRHVNRHDPRWETNLANLQIARYKGESPRPPVTLIQQTKVIRNTTNINITNLALIAPMSQINKKVVPLRTMNAAEVKTQGQNIAKLRDASLLRAKNETNLAKTIGTVRIGDRSKTLALNLPKTTPTTVLTNRIKNLPAPPQGGKGQVVVGGKDSPSTDKTKDKGPILKDKVTIPKDKTTIPKDKTTIPKDKTTIPKDKVTLPKDKTTIPKDKVTIPKDKVLPTDKVTIPKDKVTIPKDKVLPTDKVTIPKDKVTIPKDKTTIPKDKVTIPKDKITIPKDKVLPTDKVTIPKDKITIPKDKVLPTDKVTIPKDKITIPKDKVRPTDKVTIPKDKVTIPKDKVRPTDKVTIPKDKALPTDKVTIPRDKVIIPKDNGTGTTPKGTGTTTPKSTGTTTPKGTGTTTPKGTGTGTTTPTPKGSTTPKGKTGMVQPPLNLQGPIALAVRGVLPRTFNVAVAILEGRPTSRWPTA